MFQPSVTLYILFYYHYKKKQCKGGYDGVNYGIGSNGYNTGSYGGYSGSVGGFAGNNAGGYSGYPSYSSGFGRYPGATSYNRVYSSPVSTFPLGGIGTVGPSFNGGKLFLNNFI